ncbi:MAG: HK97 family phage prohead protease [Lachnospiraceae bacterium]|nr:HK97 family phage prohead protease [Lachnospiraceae bacterium]
MGREFKRLRFKMDTYNEEEGVFSGYGAVFENIDSGGDIIEPGAFTKTLAEGWERVKILALHNDYWLPIGRPVELREDQNGLYISARVSDTTMGKDVKVLLKDNVLNELSIGYDPIVFEYDQNGIRHLREVKLWEVSVVTWAMNPEARILDYKSLQETARQAQAAGDSILTDIREGRKISDLRLESLKAASQSMKAAARMLDRAIKGAGETEQGQVRQPVRAEKGWQEDQIEIYY